MARWPPRPGGHLRVSRYRCAGTDGHLRVSRYRCAGTDGHLRMSRHKFAGTDGHLRMSRPQVHVPGRRARAVTRWRGPGPSRRLTAMTVTAPGPGPLARDPLPLRGRAALVTGASRRTGIGYAIARRLAALGASVFVHHYARHDAGQPWGADPGGTEAVLAGVRAALAGERAAVAGAEFDLAGPAAPAALISAAAAEFGHLDICVCNHALSGSDGPLGSLDAAMLDAHWAVNTRSSILLAQAFAAQHDGRPGGRIVFLTSGQDLGPMTGEVAYAASKGALASVTRTLAAGLAGRAITVNTVNPGPVDTGYASPQAHEDIRRRFPRGRWGTPDDPARLIAWLATDEAAWITGQTISSEGGFRRTG
jgi:3-oxoacyl-[acyl-carrier protein] reductase